VVLTAVKKVGIVDAFISLVLYWRNSQEKMNSKWLMQLILVHLLNSEETECTYLTKESA